MFKVGCVRGGFGRVSHLGPDHYFLYSAHE